MADDVDGVVRRPALRHFAGNAQKVIRRRCHGGNCSTPSDATRPANDRQPDGEQLQPFKRAGRRWLSQSPKDKNCDHEMTLSLEGLGNDSIPKTRGGKIGGRGYKSFHMQKYFSF
jgi:hypothetical protein